MNVVLVYSRLYADCLRKALKGIGKSPWTLLLPIALMFIALVSGYLLGMLGILGGLIWSLWVDALFSAYLYFLSETVQQSKVKVSEFKKSLGVYFWSILNVLFILWLVDLMFDYAIARNPHQHTIRLGIAFFEFVLLNAVPEVLYQRHTHGFASITESVKFIQENWIEWLIPHLIVGLPLFLIFPAIVNLVGGDVVAALAVAMIAALPLAIVGGPLFHVFMVFRGHLFDALSSSTHRQRMYRYRAPN